MSPARKPMMIVQMIPIVLSSLSGQLLQSYLDVTRADWNVSQLATSPNFSPARVRSEASSDSTRPRPGSIWGVCHLLRTQLKLGIEEQRQLHLLAEIGNVSLGQ